MSLKTTKHIDKSLKMTIIKVKPFKMTFETARCYMNLREIRKKANLTQAELSKLCNCGRTTICMIENGNLKPSVKLAKRIGSILGFEWMLFYEEEGEHEKNHSGNDGRGVGCAGAGDQSRTAVR